MKRRIIITDDGSSSLELLDVKEQYHSTFGAIQEAQFVYLKNGLKYFINCHNVKSISVLEMGFGTGLNAFLTLLLSEENRININYTGVETFPLNADELSQLNYVEQLKVKKYASAFVDLHNVKHNKQTHISHYFKLVLNTNSIEEFESLSQFNLIYFDAFGPAIQPELWTAAIFKKMFGILASKGVLVTYSAKGQVRRNMQEAGFKIERLQGPPGKREMLRATKP